MTISIAHLGPTGTYSETAALAYAEWLRKNHNQEVVFGLQPSIALALKAVANQESDCAVVPVENSVEGSVAVTLDILWQRSNLKILRSFTIPIAHMLLSRNTSLEELTTVYSHPQALGQCQKWLETFLPQVKLVPTNSTAEALQFPQQDLQVAAIASARAAQLYQVPILKAKINDRPDNCTRFLVVSLENINQGNYLSLAFSLPANVSGALVKPLQIFAERNINLSKIESRPTKRSLGEYIFYLDLEGNVADSKVQSALKELEECTEVLNIFGNYDLIKVNPNINN
ncbi:MAG: prephenate dehydratase [Xenococcus sp. MO_188.B8]|nr:prephenate dehydratase [Xenococcus sp. MO_188.B8]